MTPAILLFALGVIDWLTTRAILARGGYERNPVAKWFMDRIGQTPFLLGKAALMGVAGYLASPWFWLWVPAVAIYAGFMVNNAIVLRRL